MRTWLTNAWSQCLRFTNHLKFTKFGAGAAFALLAASVARADEAGGEANLKLPDLSTFSLLGMAGSYSVAWFGIRVNTFANSRTAFAGLGGKPFPINHIPLQAGMSVGMMLISVELLMMLIILLFIPGDYAGPCFIGFAI